MKSIFMHIGAVKTGTTSIQSFFINRDNSGRLEYFPFGLLNQGHHGLAAALMGNKRFDWMVRSDLDQLKANIACIKNPTNYQYFASSEAFSTFEFIEIDGFERLKHLFKGWDITLIHFVRNQLELFESSFLQVAKTGAFLGSIDDWYDEFVRRKVGDFEHTTKKLIDVFGLENIETVCFDEEKHDLLRPIEKITGDSFNREKAGIKNKSTVLPSLVLQSLARDTGKRFIGASAVRLRRLAEKLFPDDCGGSIIPGRIESQIVDQYKESNNRLKKITGINLQPFCKERNLPLVSYSDIEIDRAKKKLLSVADNLNHFSS